jgi:hypothetical protein
MIENYIKSILVSLGVWLSCHALGDTITVKQDGTGDYTIIQDAIDASSDGDTVLVYPGTYYENINFNGRSITLASLNLLTNDPSYIHQTILDGNHSGTCITAESGESVVIHGFKITHGSGTPSGYYTEAGGIFIFYSFADIVNCIVTENHAGNGGGIYITQSPVFLSGTTISHNSSYGGAGGLGLLNTQPMTLAKFDSLNRCNIYHNYSGMGGDIFISPSDDTLTIFLDTLTVLQPDNFHIFEGDPQAVPIYKYKLDVQNAKIESVAADLYVDPNGNNDNSGLSPDAPLKTLAFALSKIKSSPDTARTIHLANGVYSPSTNGEMFPVNVRDYIHISGEDRDSTILDADSLTYLVRGTSLDHDYSLSNMTLQRGIGYNIGESTGGINVKLNYNVLFKNLLITRCYNWNATAYNNAHSINIRFEDVEVKNCHGGYSAIRIGAANATLLGPDPDTVTLVNCKIHHNGPGEEPYEGPGGGIDMVGQVNELPLHVFLINCEVTDNLATYPGRVEAGIGAYDHVEAFLVNSTIGNNLGLIGETSVAVNLQFLCKMYIINSIIYGNVPRQISISNGDEEPSELHIKYSLVQGGEDSILSWSNYNIINYDPTNIDTDPLWDTASTYPYSLSDGSPCIDAGTLNLPPGIELPEYDIAGNPRIWGESVDMGAYEYGPWVKVPTAPNSKIPRFQDSRIISVSPNPFDYGTYISYELHEKGRVNISVYSLSGKKVRSLINSRGAPGEAGKFYWDGHDEQGNELPAGTYVIRMTVEDRLVEAVKGVRSR